MTFYDRMAETATRLLTEYGQAITLTRTTGGSVDPVTGAVTAGATTYYTPMGVLRPFPDRLIDGTRILASDREVVMDSTVAPLTTDLLTIGGQAWTIINVVTVSPAGTDLVYRVQVRR